MEEIITRLERGIEVWVSDGLNGGRGTQFPAVLEAVAVSKFICLSLATGIMILHQDS